MYWTFYADPLAPRPAAPVFNRRGGPSKTSVGDVDDYPAIGVAAKILPTGSFLTAMLPDGRQVDWGLVKALADRRGVNFSVIDASDYNQHEAFIAKIKDSPLPIRVHAQAPYADAAGELMGKLISARLDLKYYGQGVRKGDYNLTSDSEFAPVVTDGTIRFPTAVGSIPFMGTAETGLTLPFGDPFLRQLMDLFPGLEQTSAALSTLMLIIVPTDSVVAVRNLYFHNKGNNFWGLVMMVLGSPVTSWHETMSLLGLVSGQCDQLLKKLVVKYPSLARILSELVEMASDLEGSKIAGDKLTDDDITPVENKIMTVMALIDFAIQKWGLAGCFQDPAKRPALNDAWLATGQPDPEHHTRPLHDLVSFLSAWSHEMGTPIELPKDIPPTGMPMPKEIYDRLAEIMAG
jgi:hypothetical protein